MVYMNIPSRHDLATEYSKMIAKFTLTFSVQFNYAACCILSSMLPEDTLLRIILAMPCPIIIRAYIVL